ncbi:hypothetical protein CRE_29722 [Caenorhabditis remanei]|uniref:Uncharacterized protein n=1 Tax=Caenorhabditis remanei TaxID=31234 RepID=E3LVD7_CAERE|nr:hypothetical protein CRE_29722 [Caenorhabditis remanei]
MNPKQRVNKRTVFEGTWFSTIFGLLKTRIFPDSDSEEEVEKPLKKKSKRSEEHEVREQNSVNGGDGDSKSGNSAYEIISFDSKDFTVISERILRKSVIWKLLTIRGPYYHFFGKFGKIMSRNRAIRKFIRRILLKIHERKIEFRDNMLPSMICSYGTEKPTVDDVMHIVEKMCKKVFCFTIAKVTIDLSKGNILSPLRKVFCEREVRLICNSRLGKYSFLVTLKFVIVILDISDNLRRLCKSMRLYISDKQTEELRNALVYYCFFCSADLLNYILSTTIDKSSGALQIQGFRILETFSNHEVNANLQLMNVSARLGSISFSTIKRRGQCSLWTSLPCEEKNRLLELVLEYGLIEELPEDAKLFLIDYVLDVRDNMRKMLTENSLRQAIESQLSGNFAECVMKLHDKRIERFLVETLSNVLNTEKMKIFEGAWIQYVLDSIKKLGKGPFGESPNCSEIYTEVCQKMNSSSLALISSYFYQATPGGQSLLCHTLLQLLRFVVHLSLNTLRHVFHFDSKRHRVTYNGELDEEVTDFRGYDHSQSRAIVSKPQSVPSTFSINSTPTIPKKTFNFTPNSVPAASLSRLPAGCDVRQVRSYRWNTSSSPPPYTTPPVGQYSYNPISFQNTHSIGSTPQFLFTPVNSQPQVNFLPAQEIPIQSNTIFRRKTLLPTPCSLVKIPVPVVSQSPVEAPQSPVENKSFIRKFPSDSTNGSYQTSSDDTRPSTVANDTPWSIDDETDIPKKWVDAYKIMLEWNQDLKSELEKAQAKLALLS